MKVHLDWPREVVHRLPKRLVKKAFPWMPIFCKRCFSNSDWTVLRFLSKPGDARHARKPAGASARFVRATFSVLTSRSAICLKKDAGSEFLRSRERYTWSPTGSRSCGLNAE